MVNRASCGFFKTHKDAIMEKNIRAITLPGYKHIVEPCYIDRFDAQYNTVRENGFTLVLLTGGKRKL